MSSSPHSDAPRPIPAYFRSLEVENTRCFGPKQRLDLTHQDRPAKWTALLGDNGVGKTTLLECLYAMAPVVEATGGIEFAVPRARGPSYCPEKRSGAHGYRIATEVAFRRKLSCDKEGLRDAAHIRSPPNNTGFAVYGYSDRRGRALCCAYAAGRRIGTGGLESRDASTSEDAFSADRPLINAAEWLLQADYAARRTRGARAVHRRDAVKRALIDLLPDVDDIREVGLDEDPPRPRVDVLTPYGWVGLRSLSLGYQTMIAWLVDLANRMFEAYPDSENPLAEAAVVLIDEFDLHLHPRWQRELTTHLDQLLPNVQFVVSAHSPLVVQAPGVTNVAVLRRQGDHVEILNDPDVVRGWRVDQILTSDLFGLQSARPVDVERDLQRHRELTLLDSPSPSEQDELSALDEKLARLPPGEVARDREAWSLAYELSQSLSKAQDSDS